MSLSTAIQSNMECPICTNAFEQNQSCVFHRTSDNWEHRVHFDCVKKWMLYHETCPFLNCTAPFPEMDEKIKTLRSLALPSCSGGVDKLLHWLLNHLRQNKEMYYEYISYLERHSEDWFENDQIMNLAIKIAIDQQAFSGLCDRLIKNHIKLPPGVLFEFLRGALREGNEALYDFYLKEIDPHKKELVSGQCASLLIDALKCNRLFWTRSLLHTRTKADQLLDLSTAFEKLAQKYSEKTLSSDEIKHLLTNLLQIAIEENIADQRLFTSFPSPWRASPMIEILVDFCINQKIRVENWKVVDSLLTLLQDNPQSVTLQRLFQIRAIEDKNLLFNQAVMRFVQCAHPERPEITLLDRLLALDSNKHLVLRADRKVLSSHPNIVKKILQFAQKQEKSFWNEVEFSSALLLALENNHPELPPLLLAYAPDQKKACCLAAMRTLFSSQTNVSALCMPQLIHVIQNLDINPLDIIEDLSKENIQSLSAIEQILQENMALSPKFLSHCMQEALAQHDQALAERIIDYGQNLYKLFSFQIPEESNTVCTLL